ncbi:MAG: hypothetical protein ABI783_05725 [Actinomycetota bacterium]
MEANPPGNEVEASLSKPLTDAPTTAQKPKRGSWAWAWIPLGIAALGCLALLAFVGLCMISWWRELPLHPPPSLPSSAVSAIPLQNDVSGRVDLTSVDGGIDADGRVHVAWCSVGLGNNSDRVWYARSEPGGAGWSAPQLLDSSSTYSARLVVAASEVHALIHGHSLRQLLKGSSSGSWKEVAPIGRPGERPADFDVVATDSGMMVAYVTWTAPDSEASVNDEVKPDQDDEVKVDHPRSGGALLVSWTSSFQATPAGCGALAAAIWRSLSR